MPNEFPLWRLRPEDAARIIILEPLVPVEKRKFWRKREMRIRPDGPYKPRTDDLKTLARAKFDGYWEALGEEYAEEFPRITIAIGPMLASGKFYSWVEPKPEHPLAAERQREKWAGLYSRQQYETEIEYLEATRALLKENFILGQRGEGPYMDGIIFMKADNLLLAEEQRCKSRLQATSALLQARRMAKEKKGRGKKVEKWQNVGNDEDVAMKFKQSGYTIRKIDTLSNRHWEVLIK